MKAAPGMTVLTAEQSAANEKIFGLRYVSIQQRPELGSRRQRRAAAKKRGKR